MAKRRIPGIPALSEDMDRFLQELQSEPDRGAALVGVAFIDETLRGLLRQAFVDQTAATDLLCKNHALQSTELKTELAYSIGLIGPLTRQEISIMREIRNEFAHSHTTVTFDQPGIADRCKHLQLGDMLLVETTERDRFILTCILVVNHLLSRALALQHPPVGPDLIVGGRVRVEGA